MRGREGGGEYEEGISCFVFLPMVCFHRDRRLERNKRKKGREKEIGMINGLKNERGEKKRRKNIMISYFIWCVFILTED